MRKFKTYKKKRPITYILFIIIMINMMLFKYYEKRIYSISTDYASSKLEYLITRYIKKDIIPKNADLSKLIKINKSKNDEITSIDINTDYAYQISSTISDKIQNNIDSIYKNNNEVYDKTLLKKGNNIYFLLPLFSADNSILLSLIGPKIPIKLDFYQFVLATVETKAREYGINDILIEVYLTITYEQKILFPYKEKKYNRDYKLLLGSKMITGNIPNSYGGFITKENTLKLED